MWELATQDLREEHLRPGTATTEAQECPKNNKESSGQSRETEIERVGKMNLVRELESRLQRNLQAIGGNLAFTLSVKESC